MPLYTARRVLPGSVDEVWAVLSDPDRFANWWPGVDRVEPSVRRALAPGAYWRVEGSSRRLFRRPGLSGGLLILEVATERRLVFQLAGEGLDVELDLEPEEDGTAATLVCRAPRFGINRSLPSQALSGLAALVRPAAT
jgi:uncharacterized protein YndB with AHSA1/START domain